MKITTSPNFLECCKNYAPNGQLDIQAISDSEKDSFVFAYLRDIGGTALQQVQKGIAEAKGYSRKGSILNSAYANCEQAMLDLGRQYNDWVDLQFDNSFNQVFNSNKAMYDAGHKSSDFA